MPFAAWNDLGNRASFWIPALKVVCMNILLSGNNVVPRWSMRPWRASRQPAHLQRLDDFKLAICFWEAASTAGGQA